jgi:hypothetical protein
MIGGHEIAFAEPVFVDLLRRPGIDSQPSGPVRDPICRTGPPGYIGWRNRFLGIDSCARNYRHSFRENKPNTLVLYD